MLYGYGLKGTSNTCDQNCRKRDRAHGAIGGRGCNNETNDNDMPGPRARPFDISQNQQMHLLERWYFKRYFSIHEVALERLVHSRKIVVKSVQFRDAGRRERLRTTKDILVNQRIWFLFSTHIVT